MSKNKRETNQGLKYQILSALEFHRTIENINGILLTDIAHFIGVNPTTIYNRLVKLIKKGLIDKRGKIYWITSSGSQEIQDTLNSPNIYDTDKTAIWEDEVLLGITVRGKQSKIEGAVMSKKRNTRTFNSTIEDQLDRFSTVNNLATRCDLSIEDVLFALENGMVKFCKKCDKKSVFEYKKTGALFCRACRLRKSYHG